MTASPTPRLIAGLAVTLAAAGVFSWYSLEQVHRLERLQEDAINRNRKDSLQLLRIQNSLNSLGLALRDMLEGEQGYPLTAWRGEFRRLREDLRDAVRLESALARRPAEQQAYLTASLEQLWRSVDEVFTIAEAGEPERARKIITNSLQAQQAAVSSTVARLLVANNEAEEAAAGSIQRIYGQVERDTYLFIAAMLITMTLTSLAAIYANRRIFDRLARLSAQRSTLSRKLIGVQEEVLKSVSRELHDEFGQILTAIGTMLSRADRKHIPPDSPLRAELAEVKQIVQESLDKTRSLSQALRPSVLDDYGLEQAMERFVPAFERQTGIHVRFKKQGSAMVPEEKAIHVYRVLQEALNNVARHSKTADVDVRVEFGPDRLHLEVEDHGIGMNTEPAGNGLGLIAMKERAELLGGTLSLSRPPAGGTLVELEAPLR